MIELNESEIVKRTKGQVEGRRMLLDMFAKACFNYYVKGYSKLTDKEFDGLQNSAKVVYPEFMEVWNMVGYDEKLVNKYREINE